MPENQLFALGIVAMLIILFAVNAWRAEKRHAELISLLNDWATMDGDLLGAILKELKQRE